MTDATTSSDPSGLAGPVDGLLARPLATFDNDAQLRLATELMPQLVWTTTADGYHDYYNARWYEYTGMPREAGQGWNWSNFVHPDDLERTQTLWQHSLRTGEPYDVEYRLRRASDGMYRWFVGRAMPLRDAGGRIVRWFGTCTDIDDAKHIEASLRVLAEAGAALVATLDVHAALCAVARIAVPRLGDWCAVDMVDAGGGVRRVAVEHPDPAKVALAHDLARRYPTSPDSPRGVSLVLRTGEPDVMSEIPEELFAASAHDEEHLRLLRALGLRSYVVAPIHDGGTVLGAITVVSAEAGRRYTDFDVQTVQELARRAGTAVERARMYQQSVAMRERLEEQGAELAAQNEALQQQTVELEMQTEQMQEQATELEMQNEQLQEQAAELELQAQQLEEQSVEMELSNHELSMVNVSLRAMEERLTLALQSGGLGWWEWELPSQRITWSPQVEAMHGMPAGSFDGTVATYLSLVHPDDRERVQRVLARSLAGVDEQYHVSHRFVRHDGSVRWLEANARLRHDEHGTPTSLLGIVTDATERVELLASEQSARQAAEAANLAKATFLATMSHELRTPLNAITGYADLLALGIRGPVNEAQLDDLTRIKKSSQHLLSLINDILNFARLEAGRVEFNVSDVPVRELLADVDALVTPQMAGKGLRYETDACLEQLVVRGDREKIQQVLLNLMTNAIKFTDEGGITMACDGDATTVRLRVRDTGRGIAPEKLGSIFQPFVQIDRQLTSESQQGVGLGLAISRDLARGMGGDLTVESTLGQGSTFTLALPRA